MPIHEFECPKCGHKIDKFFTSSNLDIEDMVCEICGELMKRLVSKSTFVLKGSGWAKDGYRQ